MYAVETGLSRYILRVDAFQKVTKTIIITIIVTVINNKVMIDRRKMELENEKII